MSSSRTSAGKAVVQYLDRHALHRWLPDNELAVEVDHAVVVPIRGEVPSFIDGMVPALVGGQKMVVIVVVNGSDGDEAWVHRANAIALAELRRRTAELRERGVELCLLDHAAPGRRFSSDQGVGMARRLGLDLAVALWARGRVRSPWIVSTDGDASLPVGVSASAPRSCTDIAALTLPFWHIAGGDWAVDRATGIYELWLRYYVLGLASAGSPFAFQAMGSALAVHAWAYAAVRGIPTRLAGEDFHLLAKLAKVGAIAQARIDPVLLQARRSQRTPFGTGSAVAAMVDTGREPEFFAPAVFDVLRGWVAALETAAVDPRIDSVDSTLSVLPLPQRRATEEGLARIGCQGSLGRVLDGAHGPRLRRQRLHGWFDALKTLRFLRALRSAIPDRPWNQAVAEASAFADAPPCDDLDAVRRWALAREQTLPMAGLYPDTARTSAC